MTDSLSASPSFSDIMKNHDNHQDSLLPLLHDIQDAYGYVPPSMVSTIAESLHLSRAEVHGVLTYYHHFRQTPPGRHVLRICRAEACQALGSEALIACAQQSIDCHFHETSPDGAITLEPVYCLGLCGCGPAVQVDETELFAEMDSTKLEKMIHQWKEEK